MGIFKQRADETREKFLIRPYRTKETPGQYRLERNAKKKRKWATEIEPPLRKVKRVRVELNWRDAIVRRDYSFFTLNKV